MFFFLIDEIEKYYASSIQYKTSHNAPHEALHLLYLMRKTLRAGWCTCFTDSILKNPYQSSSAVAFFLWTQSLSDILQMSVCQECDVPAKVRATRDLSNNIPLTVSEGHDALIPGVFVQQKQTKRVPAGETLFIHP